MIAKELRGILYIILFLFLIILSINNLYEKSNYYSIIFIISINLLLLIWFLSKKYTQTFIIYIYFIYNALTLKIPLLWIIINYSNADIENYFSLRNLKIDDMINANIYILIFDLLLIIFLYFFLNKGNNINNIKSIYNKLYFSHKSKTGILIILLAISYASKFYLIQTGVWFFYLMNDIDTTKIPFYSLVNTLEKLDLFVLLYFVYKFKLNKLSKKEIILFFIIIIISIAFALISTSKAKVIFLLFPLILLIIYLKKRLLPIILLIAFIPLFSIFFDTMTYLRHNSNKSIIEVFNEPEAKNNSFNKIYNDKLITRLDYQTVVANVMKIYPSFPNEIKFDYLNNIIGLIPRAIWSNKPIMSIDLNKIGYEIGYLHISDKYTAVGITPLGIAYYELGIYGVIFISFFTASLIAFFSNRLDSNYWIGFLLSIMIAISLARNGTYTNIIPSLVQTILIFFIISLLTASKFKDEKKIKEIY